MSSCEFKFTVEGHGTFPIDMLRRDACWPETTDDAVVIQSGVRGPVKVNLVARRLNRSWGEPNFERWASFGWRVTSLTQV